MNKLLVIMIVAISSIQLMARDHMVVDRLYTNIIAADLGTSILADAQASINEAAGAKDIELKAKENYKAKVLKISPSLADDVNAVSTSLPFADYIKSVNDTVTRTIPENGVVSAAPVAVATNAKVAVIPGKSLTVVPGAPKLVIVAPETAEQEANRLLSLVSQSDLDDQIKDGLNKAITSAKEDVGPVAGSVENTAKNYYKNKMLKGVFQESDRYRDAISVNPNGVSLIEYVKALNKVFK